MSLVAYGSSDESDNDETASVPPTNKGGEEEHHENDNLVNDFIEMFRNREMNITEEMCQNNAAKRFDLALNNFMQSNTSGNTNNNAQTTNNGNVSAKPHSNNQENELFCNLPTPKGTYSIPDNTLKLLSKKQPVKIVLPSLNEIKVDEVKKPKPSTKGSGLFALLPAPKNASSLIPNVVKKASNVTATKPLVPSSLTNKKPVKSIKLSKTSDIDVDDDESYEPKSFFFNSVDDVKPEEMEPVDIPEVIQKNNPSTTKMPVQDPNINEASVASNSDGSILPDGNFPVDNNMEVSDINDEAIMKLCGAGARKRKGVPEEIIDINVNSVVQDAYMWLSKDISKEQEHTGFKKAKNLSVVERRKHQITYLASQAKEKEMELRNQWANSRMSRKQTQSKYGF